MATHLWTLDAEARTAARDQIEEARYMLEELLREINVAEMTEGVPVPMPDHEPAPDPADDPYLWRLDELDTAAARLRAILVPA